MLENERSYYFQQEKSGVIEISGADRLDFLQRQTTNDLKLLAPGQSIVTILTSPSARILDVLWVVDEDNGHYNILTLPGQGSKTIEFLNSRIFFMDKVTLENQSDEFIQFDLFGNGIPDLLRGLGVDPDLGKSTVGYFKVKSLTGKALTNPHIGTRLLFPSSQKKEAEALLDDNNFQPLSPGDYQILRIELGIPAAGQELVEDYTPLEIGYQWAISENKGCYTGQEVIARQVNYDKVTRHLVGLSQAETPEEKEIVYSRENGQPVGKVTSAALSPRFGSIALAVIKRPFHEPGTALFFRQGDQELEAVAIKLPFQ